MRLLENRVWKALLKKHMLIQPVLVEACGICLCALAVSFLHLFFFPLKSQLTALPLDHSHFRSPVMLHCMETPCCFCRNMVF